MRQIFVTAILILIFCPAVFAQAVKDQCQKIEIQAPASVFKDLGFNATVKFKGGDNYVNEPIRWKIIKNNEVSDKIGEEIITIDVRGIEAGDSIVVLAETIDEKCRRSAVAKVFVEIPCALPTLVDEYGRLNWNAEKARINNVAFQFKQIKEPKDAQNFKLFAFLEFDKNTSGNFIKNRLAKILGYLSTNQKIKKEKIVFLISETDNERVRYQFLPSQMEDTLPNDFLVIRGNNFNKLENLFQATIKKRKK